MKTTAQQACSDKWGPTLLACRVSISRELARRVNGRKAARKGELARLREEQAAARAAFAAEWPEAVPA